MVTSSTLAKKPIGHNVGSSHPELAKWIETSGPQVSSQRDEYNVSLGPKGQFFAVSNLGHRWHKVPDEFHGHVQNMLAGGGRWKEGWEPSGALFGVNNSYLITCKGGRHLAFSSNLSKQYPGLHKRVKERFERAHGADRVYDYITLNPYVANEWVVVWADDTVSWSLPPSILELAGPVGNWLSTKAGVYKAPSPSPSPSTTTSTASTPTLPSAPLSHNNSASTSNNLPPSPTPTYKFNPKPMNVSPPQPSPTRSSPAPPRFTYPTGASSRPPSYTASYKSTPSPSSYPTTPSNQTHSYTTPSYTSPSYTTHSYKPPYRPTYTTPAVPSMPTMWTQPNDTSTTEMLHLLNDLNKQMSNSFFSGSGGGGSSSLFQFPGGGGGDPTGGLFSGLNGGGGMGMGMGGFDPGSIANGGMLGMGGMGGGLDPTSMMMMGQNQCVIM